MDRKRNPRTGVVTVVVVCALGGVVFGQPWDGNGVEGDPYLIYDANDMQAIGADSNYWDAHFKLMADIDLSSYTGTSFNIIGIFFGYNNPGNKPFTGVFDGNDHTISNFTYDSNGVDYIGLFSCLQDAEVKDLGLVSPNVSGGDGNNVGGLVGYLLYGSVSECYVEGGSVTGGDYVGGLVGYLPVSNVSECYIEGGSVTGINYVGGLVGYRGSGDISSCYSTGVVSGEDYVGGLIGKNLYTVANSYSMCSVTGESYVGGLLGNGGGIYYCYSTGSVSGTADVGGLAGYSTIAAVGSFWDIETSGIDYSSTGTGLTTAQMQSLSTFAASGWGCDGAWTIDDGNDYPRLVWEDSGGELITGQLTDLVSGAGSEAEPFEIYTAEELNLIGLFMYEWDKHFKLMADIDVSGIIGRGFNIIGLYSNRPFTGVFDGNGHTISNFTYDSNGLNYIGLFGYIDDPDAEIKNLGLVNPDVNAGDGFCVGGLVGRLYEGSVTGCYVEGGSVSGAWGVGGLAGENYRGDIQGCYSTGDVTGEFRVGGLVGANVGSLSNSYSMGSVIGDERVGGLVGESYRGSITNSYSAGSVTGETDTGGLIGFNYQDIVFSDSLWDVNSSGQTTSAGGIGRSTEQMQSLNTFVEYGWGGCGNGGEWTIDDGNDYPRLA
jgi:hypothetical protein